MEEEEREAQSAKLQELIRRGTPQDLQEANRLMKIMAGYDVRSKTDYRAKAAKEVSKVQAKARILEERLENFRPGAGDKMEDNDVFGELAAALRSAQPKIQKMCEEESEDHEAVAKLLAINDSIHRTIRRYELMKKGDLDAANKIQSEPSPSHAELLSSTAAVSKGAAQELSLIDLDVDPVPSQGGSIPELAKSSNGLEDDLLGLSLGTDSMPPISPSPELLGGGGIALPVSTAASPSPGSVSSAAANMGPFASLSSTATTGDDEWAFSSALPPEEPAKSMSQERRGIVSDTLLKIEFLAIRPAGAPSISISFAFSNNTAHPITEIHSQVAVTKVCCSRRPLFGRGTMTLTTALAGLRASTKTAIRTRAGSESGSGRDPGHDSLASGRSQPEGKVRADAVEGVVLGCWGTKDRDGRDSRI